MFPLVVNQEPVPAAAEPPSELSEPDEPVRGTFRGYLSTQQYTSWYSIFGFTFPLNSSGM